MKPRREGYAVMQADGIIVRNGENPKIYFNNELQRAYDDEVEPTVKTLIKKKKCRLIKCVIILKLNYF